MRRQQVTFFVWGLVGGAVSVGLAGSSSSPEFAVLVLTFGTAVLFFVAVVGGIVTTGVWRHIRVGFGRYVALLILSLLVYWLTMFTLFSVVSWSGASYADNNSPIIPRFGAYVWLALIAAGIVWSAGMCLMSAVLARRWSWLLLMRLCGAAAIAILTTFIVNFPFHKYWSFFGVLLPVGNALFCYVVGIEIWRHIRRTKRLA